MPQCIIFSDPNFQKSNLKKRIKKKLISLFVACGLILLISKLSLIVISCKMFSGSMKFKFIYEIAIIHKKFLVLFNLLPDMTYSGPDLGHGLCIPDLL